MSECNELSITRKKNGKYIHDCLLLKHLYTIGISKNKTIEKEQTFLRVLLHELSITVSNFHQNSKIRNLICDFFIYP